MREQIQWQQQPYSHNQACLDLIAAKPHGILRILDDQCNFPQVAQRTCACMQSSISQVGPLAPEPGRRVARVLKSFVALVN